MATQKNQTRKKVPAQTKNQKRLAQRQMKRVLADRVGQAVSGVFNEGFHLWAEVAPRGRASAFCRWYMQTLRRELTKREAALPREWGGVQA